MSNHTPVIDARQRGSRVRITVSVDTMTYPLVTAEVGNYIVLKVCKKYVLIPCVTNSYKKAQRKASKPNRVLLVRNDTRWLINNNNH